MTRPSDPPEHNRGPLAPMPVGELRDDGALQVQDLLIPAPPPLVGPSDWRALFDAEDSRELLERLAHRDPLCLRSRVLRVCRDQALILHADRLLLYNRPRCAHSGRLYGGSPPLSRWCDDIVAAAARDLMSEDIEVELDGEPVIEEDFVLYRMFVELYGVEPALSRIASVRFHACELAARRVAWSASIEGRSLAEIATTQALGAEAADAHLRACLRALSDTRRPSWKDLAAHHGEDVP